jgi:hypothetical protein
MLARARIDGGGTTLLAERQCSPRAPSRNGGPSPPDLSTAVPRCVANAAYRPRRTQMAADVVALAPTNKANLYAVKYWYTRGGADVEIVARIYAGSCRGR